jgi:hypothetical protein
LKLEDESIGERINMKEGTYDDLSNAFLSYMKDKGEISDINQDTFEIKSKKKQDPFLSELFHQVEKIESTDYHF